MERREIQWSLDIPKGHDIRFPKDKDYLTVTAKSGNKAVVGRISRGIEFFHRLRTLRDRMVGEISN